MLGRTSGLWSRWFHGRTRRRRAGVAGPRAGAILDLELLETRLAPSTYTMPLVNQTGLSSSQISVFVLGFSTKSKLMLQDNGTFGAFPSSEGKVKSYNITSLNTITLDSSTTLDGGRIYFFVAPAGSNAPEFDYTNSGANVTQPKNGGSAYPPFDIVEITQLPPGLPVVDVQTVDGYIFPLTLTIFDGASSQLGQVGSPLYPAGQNAVVNRNYVFGAYTSFMTSQGSAGSPYLAMTLPQNTIAGQAGGILNPGLFLSLVNNSNALANLSRPLNTVWDSDLNALFGTTTLSIQGVAAGAIAADVYTVNSIVSQPYPGSTFSLPALQLKGTTNGLLFNVFNPVGATVSTNADGSSLIGTVNGNTLTLAAPPPAGLVANMYLTGAGINPGDTITQINGNVLTLSANRGIPAPNSPYLFSKIPNVFETSGRMVFANDGVFADNTVQFPANGDAATVLGNLENQLVTALNRGVALSGPTSGAAGYSSQYWGTQSNWYPAGKTQNLFSLFMHTGQIGGTPIFLQPPGAAANARGMKMGQAYGFAFDENAGPVPPAPSGQPPVPSKFDPVPGATTTIRVTLGAWVGNMATGAAGQFPSGIAVGDFNGDGLLDATTANYGPTGGNSVSVLFGTGHGTFNPATSTLPLPAGTNPFGITTGKFIDGSNNLSIVTGNFAGQSVSVILGNGNGTFLAPLILPAKDSADGLHKIVQVAVGDLNGDTRNDIVAASGDGTYTVFLGNGNGTFAPLPAKSALTPIFGVAIANFDTGAGLKPGLVVGAFAANKVGVLPGNGDGTFAAPIFTLVESGGPVAITPEFIATGDFNKDGKIDVATSNKDANSVSILLGNGNGTFSPATTLGVGNTPLGIAVSDLNNGGNLDVVVANLGSNSISALLGNGDGTFATPLYFGGLLNPLALAAGDFDPSSGMIDMVLTNFFGFQQDVVSILSNIDPRPTITSFNPGSGPVGSPVVLTGVNFLSVVAVLFNGVPATNITINSATQITVLVPTGATTGLISVSGSAGIGVSAMPFTVT